MSDGLSDGLSSTCKIFADDIFLFSFAHDKYVARDELNSDFKKISGLALQWKMKFNPDPNKQAQELYFSNLLHFYSKFETVS